MMRGRVSGMQSGKTNRKLVGLPMILSGRSTPGLRSGIPCQLASWKRLVWSMPTVQVATLFGVSDVAIGKRCKAAGIQAAVGLLAKGGSRLLAHPNGKPMRETK